jgi:uncharacterized membrane protein (UPF0127 family)
MPLQRWTVVVACVAAAALSACGGSSGDGDAAAPTSSTAPVAGAAPTTTAAPATGTAAADPTTTSTGVPARVAPAGFATVPGVVTAADGATCEVCLWLADEPALRAQGLMGVTDLSGADGMVFRWDEPTTGGFWMRDTPSPLSIAFYDADGAFVSATDMAPCLQPTPDAECARYAAAGPYAFAVEVAAGGLDELLMGPGSRLALHDGDCPLAP